MAVGWRVRNSKRLASETGQAHVSVGSKAALTAPKSNFRFSPRKRTQVGHRAMSEKCQERKPASFMRLLSRALPANWYGKLKNRAVGVRLDKPQFAAAACNQGGRDGEPQSHTTRFCRKERIEYALSV